MLYTYCVRARLERRKTKTCWFWPFYVLSNLISYIISSTKPPMTDLIVSWSWRSWSFSLACIIHLFQSGFSGVSSVRSYTENPESVLSTMCLYLHDYCYSAVSCNYQIRLIISQHKITSSTRVICRGGSASQEALSFGYTENLGRRKKDIMDLCMYP
jgi:hypothetical protein